MKLLFLASSLFAVGYAQEGITSAPSKTSRVAVVGAGPSGLGMAHELSKLGFVDITVLEKSNRVGEGNYVSRRLNINKTEVWPVRSNLTYDTHTHTRRR